MRSVVFLFVLFAGFPQLSVNTMEQQTLKTYLEWGAPFDFVLIDLRQPDEITAAIGAAHYRANCGLIGTCEYPGCKPYNLTWPKQFKKLVEKIPKDQTIIVYCKSGDLAVKAASYLNERGFIRAYSAGGFLTWKGSTVPASEIKPVTLLPEPSCQGHTEKILYQ